MLEITINTVGEHLVSTVICCLIKKIYQSAHKKVIRLSYKLVFITSIKTYEKSYISFSNLRYERTFLYFIYLKLQNNEKYFHDLNVYHQHFYIKCY